MKFEKVSVVGLGYIGLPTAAVLASRGIQVIGVDVNQRVVDALNKGAVTIVEPDLDMVVHAAVTTGKLSATTTPQPADAFLIAVPTPFKDAHVPDLSYIEAVANTVAPVLQPGNLVVLESTSPVGATEQMAEWMAAARSDLTFSHQAGDEADIHIAHCPERVLPGHVMRELVENDRVIGGLSVKATQMAVALYKIFVTGECLQTDARTAELCKLVENSFRDVNIAFANELSVIAERFGIDVWELITLANRHPRVNILQPGPGVGGHCIAVDPWFIVHSAPDQARLIRTAREVNDYKPHHVIEKIVDAAKGFAQPRIACLGLAFKADIDDLRESPSLDIVKRLADIDLGELLVVEPYVDELPKSLQGYDRLRFVGVDEAVRAADIVVVFVKHKPFLSIDRTLLEGKHIIDTCGAWR
ncbi:MAG: UDP-N-acetyl-D-mannosaminuronic acid dehydrogenase [Hoeflea sp. BRH_c9]|nr:MAG: UDP-N-acetyl-D-mannosaminuronic acid dehydrogenase [Hoeflea sp. BRH_c9]